MPHHHDKPPADGDPPSLDGDQLDLGTLTSSSPDVDFATYKLSGSNLSSLARISPEGKLVIDLSLARALPDLPKDYANDVREPDVEQEPAARPKDTKSKWEGVVPNLNILLLIVGSRGDVQPYIALALALVAHGHRVRIGTHGEFREFVGTAGQGKVEFFEIGGDPKDLMAWMVKNPGLIPGFESLTNGDVQRKQKQLAEIMNGAFKATHEPDAETGRAFAADALISNPPAFAHIHLAEALGLPLQLTFTMPWSATTAFNHPLVQIKSTNAPPGLTNYLSFSLADVFTWQGLADITNTFRTTTLGLAPLSLRSGPSVTDRLKVPWTYCWSPALIPKPDDWKNMTDISSFYFLDLASGYEPPDDLAAFLAAGEPPIYIGFGSVPVSDPKAMSAAIFAAVKQAGVRALVSVGWGGLGGADVDTDNVFLLGNVPHDWLFKQVKAVVHHGGAGTTAIGLLNGLPTVIVPFFGDQQFWGDMVANAGAGPKPIPSKTLNADNLAEGIKFALADSARTAAKKMGEQIRAEDGVASGVDSFHRHLPLKNMRCDVDPSLVAVWWSDKYCLRLSALAAAALADAKKLKMAELEPHRPKEYDTRKQATDPITGGAAAILSTVTNYYVGIGTIFLNPPKGIVNTATAIPKGMLNIVSSIHEGFSNLPKAYGSEVRQSGKVSDWKSGLQEGVKGLAAGYYDGILGLVKEPLEGGKKEGLLGVIKGAGRSYANVTMKPAAGIVGLIAHPADGAWKSVQSLWAQKQLSVLRQVRIADGEAAHEAASSSTTDALLARFAELDKETGARREALETRAREILEGKVRQAEGQDGEDEPPSLTLTEDTSEDEADDAGIKTPEDDTAAPADEAPDAAAQKPRVGRRSQLSERESQLLQQLAAAEQKGYERAKKEEKAA